MCVNRITNTPATTATQSENKYGAAVLYGIVLGFVVFLVTEMADRAGSAGVLDPSPLVTHHMSLDEAPEAYAIYDRREALKIVLRP